MTLGVHFVYTFEGCISFRKYCSVPKLNTLGVMWYLHLYIDRCIPQGERIACVWPFSITPSQGQPHSIFRGLISISGQWMLSWEELLMAEHSPHITMQCFAVLYSLLFYLYTFVMLNCLLCVCVCVCVCVCGCLCVCVWNSNDSKGRFSFYASIMNNKVLLCLYNNILM